MVDEQSSASMAPGSVVFWRHVVLVVALSSYVDWKWWGEGPGFFVGAWLGTVAIVFGSSALLAGVGYLFFTRIFRGRFWKIFLCCAWLVALALALGRWYGEGAADQERREHSRYFDPNE